MNMEQNTDQPEDELNPQIDMPQLPEKKSNKRKYGFIILGLLLLSYAFLSWTGLFRLNFYIGAYSIENAIVTSQLDSNEQPLENRSETTFAPTDRINTAVYTSGSDGIVGMRWYYEDGLIFEHFSRTNNNYTLTYLSGSVDSPLPNGEYRVEVLVDRNSAPKKTVRFTVTGNNVTVVPRYPIPAGHIDIENSLATEVPFVFDEIWLINGEEWHINEVKIVFLKDAELFVVVVDSELSLSDFSADELDDKVRPVAQYAIDNGFWDQARAIKINGQTYALDEPLAITLINSEKLGSGYRARFDIDELRGTP